MRLEIVYGAGGSPVRRALEEGEMSAFMKQTYERIVEWLNHLDAFMFSFGMPKLEQTHYLTSRRPLAGHGFFLGGTRRC